MGIIQPQTLFAAWSNSLRTVLWSSQGGEWTHRANDRPVKIAGALASEINGRDIVLLHDNNFKVPAVLEKVLPAIIKRGFDVTAGVKYLK